MRYEYKVIHAPAKGEKAKGVRGAADRFAHALEMRVNALAIEGWEYVRCDTLPSEERAGLTQTQTVWRNLLVFRRPTQAALSQPEAPRLIAPPADEPAAAPRQPHLRAVDSHAEIADDDPEAETERDSDTQDDVLLSLPGPLRARALRLRAVQNG
jgi:hypothetical protein